MRKKIALVLHSLRVHFRHGLYRWILKDKPSYEPPPRRHTIVYPDGREMKE